MRCEIASYSWDDQVKAKCPECGEDFHIPIATGTADIVGATMDCPECDTLLLGQEVDGIVVVVDFHKRMNQFNSNWSTVGEGAGYIEISDPHMWS